MKKLLLALATAALLLTPSFAQAGGDRLAPAELAPTTAEPDPNREPIQAAADGRECEGACECEGGRIGYKMWEDGTCWCVCGAEVADEERSVE